MDEDFSVYFQLLTEPITASRAASSIAPTLPPGTSGGGAAAAGRGTELVVRQYWDVISLRWVRVLIMAVTMLGVIVALIGNGLVIVIIWRRRSLRQNPTILFILNLALCDLISCLVYRPLLLLEVFLPFTPHFHEFVNHLDKCKVASYFKGLFAAVGFHTMVAISQERLLLIVYPLRAKSLCTASRTARILAAIWATAALLVLPIPLKYTEIISVDIHGTTINFCAYFSGARLAIVYHAAMFAFYFAVPLVVITAAYVKIFNVLYRRQRGLDVNQDSGGGKSMRIRRNLAKMMLSVSAIFAVAWGPHFIFFLHVACGGKVPKNGFFTATVVEFLPIISSIMNPLLYTLNSRTFRAGFKSIIFRRRPSDEASCARSFINGETTVVNSMVASRRNKARSTRFGGFSSFRLAGSSRCISFVSGRRKDAAASSAENGVTTITAGMRQPSLTSGETSSELSPLAPAVSRRNAFNNNNFELTQRSESTPYVKVSINSEPDGSSSFSASSHKFGDVEDSL